MLPVKPFGGIPFPRRPFKGLPRTLVSRSLYHNYAYIIPVFSALSSGDTLGRVLMTGPGRNIGTGLR